MFCDVLLKKQKGKVNWLESESSRNLLGLFPFFMNKIAIDTLRAHKIQKKECLGITPCPSLLSSALPPCLLVGAEMEFGQIDIKYFETAVSDGRFFSPQRKGAEKVG